MLLFAGIAVALALAYVTSRRSIEESFHEQAQAALDGMVRNAQRQLEVVEDLQSQAPVDRDVRRYLVSRKGGAPDALILLEEAVAGLRARILPVRALENLAVYLVEERFLITALGAEEARFFFDRYRYEGTIEAQAPGGDVPRFHTRRVQYEDSFPLIALVRYTLLDQRPVATITHLRPQRLLPDGDPGESAFLIYAPEMGLLASSGAEVELPGAILASGHASGRQASLRGGWHYVYAERDEQTGWLFAYVVPATSLAIPLRRLGFLTLLLAAGVLAAAGLVVVLVAATVYRPVREVLRSLFPDSRPGASATRRGRVVDEFEAIAGLFAQLRAQNLRLGDILTRARPLLREGAVRDLVTGRLSAEEIQRRLAEAELDFDGNLFTIAILQLGASPSPTVARGLEALGCVRRGVVASSRSLLGGWKSEIAETDDERIVVLINHDAAADQRARIRFLVQEIQESVHRQIQVAASAVVGRSCDTLGDLPLRYRESVRMLERGCLWTPGILVMAEEAAEEDEEVGFSYPVERERSLINAAISGDWVYAVKGILEVLESNLVARSLRGEARRHLLWAVAGTIERICNRLHVRAAEILGSTGDVYGAITGYQSWAELRKGIETICSAIAARIARDRKQHDDRLRERFGAYIEANYRRSVSLLDMAEAFSLTPSYLSELFKERMGENYIDYLTAHRMEVAKRLLATTTLRVNDVAVESGYTNVTSFIRVFKKHEGVSPGAYRELSRQNES